MKLPTINARDASSSGHESSGEITGHSKSMYPGKSRFIARDPNFSRRVTRGGGATDEEETREKGWRRRKKGRKEEREKKGGRYIFAVVLSAVQPPLPLRPSWEAITAEYRGCDAHAVVFGHQRSASTRSVVRVS